MREQLIHGELTVVLHVHACTCVKPDTVQLVYTHTAGHELTMYGILVTRCLCPPSQYRTFVVHCSLHNKREREREREREGTNDITNDECKY